MDRSRRSVSSESYSDQGDSEEKASEPDLLSSTSTDEHWVGEHSVQTVEPLTASQVEETQELIDVRTSQLEKIDTELAELQERLSTVHQRRCRIVKDLLEGRARLSVMRKVSQDVISMIFAYFVMECKQSPWILMHVDRKWRQTALGTRSIWTGIEITSISWQNEGHDRSRDGRELCATEQQLRLAIARAGNLCLDIRIFAEHPGRRNWGRKESNIFSGVIAAFVQLGTKLRIASLRVEGQRSYLITLKNIAFDQLQNLQFDYFNDGLVQSVASSARSLKSLQLDFFSNSSLDPAFPWWSEIRSLRLGPRFGGRSRWSQSIPSLMAHTLSKATSLQDLELNESQYFYPANTTLQFPQLLTLSTYAFIGPVQINAPLLTQLKLRQQEAHQREPPNITEQKFPSLTHLEVECVTKRLQYIVAPSLHTLIIRNSSRYVDNSDAVPKIWLDPNRQHFLNPVVLHIIKISIRLSTLWDLLSALDRLEELFIEGLPLKKSFFVDLGQGRIVQSQNPEKWAAPSLKRLRLDFSECNHVEKVPTLRTAATKCNKSRQKFGLELESVQVKVARGGEWLTLVG